MPSLQLFPLHGEHVVFDTGDDGHTRLLGGASTFALRTVLETLLRQHDRPGFLDALVARTGQAWEGVLGYAFAGEDDPSIPAGKVFVFFQDDEVFIDDAVFTALVMAHVRAHLNVFDDQVLATRFAEVLTQLEHADHPLPDGVTRPFVPTTRLRIRIDAPPDALSASSRSDVVAELLTDGHVGQLMLFDTAIKPALLTLFFTPQPADPATKPRHHGTGNASTAQPMHAETLIAIIDHDLPAYGLRGEIEPMPSTRPDS